MPSGRMDTRNSGVYSASKTRAVEGHTGNIPGLDMGSVRKNKAHAKPHFAGWGRKPIEYFFCGSP